MDTIKTFAMNSKSFFVELDWKNDRKLQLGIAVTAVSTIIIVRKLKQKRNYFLELPKYESNSDDQSGDDKLLSNLKRCAKPSDELDIVFAKKGPASAQPITIQQMWDIAVREGGDLPFIGVEEYVEPTKEWIYKFISWTEADIIFNNIGKALIALNVNKFDVCNIIGGCTSKFHHIFFGVIMAGAIPGGCYTTNLSGSLKYICNLCKTKVVFAENRLQLNKYLEVIGELKTVKYIVVYDDDDQKQDNIVNNTDIKIINFKEFMEYSVDKDGKLEKELNNRKQSANPKQCAVLIYTSGTTGGSKGCMLSHDNIYQMLHCSAETYRESGGTVPDTQRQIAYLPLSHIAGQVLTWWNPMYYRAYRGCQATTYFARKDWRKSLKYSLAACQPTTFISVPRIYEKFYEGIVAGLANASFIKKALFRFILWIGRDNYRNTLAGGSGEIPHLWNFVSTKLCDGVIKKGIGFGSCNIFVSGGAPLANNIRETFAALNMKIVDAYGLSETSGASVLSRPNNFVADACGPPSIGTQLLIDHRDGRDQAGHGEICMRGRHIMMGYINEYDKTSKTFDSNGWLHSGDIGYIDKYECLHITGRIKELLVTAGGENVAPVPVENYIKQLIPELSQAIMIGDKRKYCSIILSIATEVDDDGNPLDILQAHSKLVNNQLNTVKEVINDNIWHNKIRKALIQYNNDPTICTSNSTRIKYFQILHKDLNVNDGTLSASLKVKRHTLYKIYKKEIDALYGDNPSIAVVPRK